jgi:phosphatidylethanolamine-binding protein (PEBP) family uncharacterized protein
VPSAPAKTTSARVTLALVAVGLLLSGCGGASDSDSTTTASSPAAQKSAAAGAAESKSSSAGASKAKPGAPSAATSGPNAAAQGQGQKHGAAIAAPKGPKEQAPSPEQVTNATVADMTLQSPAITATAGAPGRLAPTHTCDGANSWPALQWGGVPPQTAELVLYAMSVQPVEGRLFVDWALAGLDPGLSGIEAAKLPRGAVVGTNSFGEVGYSICPPGPSETYLFAIYALPQRLALKRGFDAREVRRRILDVSGNVGLLAALAEHS